MGLAATASAAFVVRRFAGAFSRSGPDARIRSAAFMVSYVVWAAVLAAGIVRFFRL